ncbi:MAG: hypothetical protein Q4D54_06265 [Eubacteriales bacterium]|nr:hypothetical protein [Eubacteriales bacterium]
MSISDTNNSILPDDTSGNSNDALLQGSPNGVKSVSAIQGLVSGDYELSDEKGNISKGVPIHSFDELIANMESLNIKFFN